MLTTLITATFILGFFYFIASFTCYALDNICKRHRQMIYDRYNQMTVKTLKAIAKYRGMTKYSRMKKHDLVLLLMA